MRFACDRNGNQLTSEVTLPAPVITGVHINESQGYVQRNVTYQFSATVEGLHNPSQDVIWSIEGNSSASTSISQRGVLTVAANESARFITVVVRTPQTPVKTDSLTLEVLYQNQPTTITIAPFTAAVPWGKSLQFAASLSEESATPDSVAWSVRGNSSSGTSIDPYGRLTTSCCEWSWQIIVRADSIQTPGLYAAVRVEVLQWDGCFWRGSEMVEMFNTWVCSYWWCCQLCGSSKVEVDGTIVCPWCFRDWFALGLGEADVNELRSHSFQVEVDEAVVNAHSAAATRLQAHSRFVEIDNPLADVTPNLHGYVFDNQISQLASNSPGVIETRTYDAFNRLIRVERPGMTSTYNYRADGLRRSKTVNGTVTQHVWNGMHIVLERNATGEAISRFTRGLNGHLIHNHQQLFYLFNARGDVVQLVDAAGRVVRTYQYDAFGNELNPDPSDHNMFRFAGEYFDRHRGEYYLRARSFNPRTGRFTQPDPFWNIHNMLGGTGAILQSANLYLYVMNNPIMFGDPSGLSAIVLNNRGFGGVTGHMSVFVRDANNTWHYFYWGPDFVHFHAVADSSVMSTVTGINQWIRGQGMNSGIPGSGDYYRFVYIPGDFSAAVAHFSGLYNDFDTHMLAGGGRDVWHRALIRGQMLPGVTPNNNLYSVARRNCVHVTMEGLNKGILNNGTSVGDFITAAGYNRADFRPAVQMTRLQSIFGNSVHTRTGATAQLTARIAALRSTRDNPQIFHCPVGQQSHIDRLERIGFLFD